MQIHWVEPGSVQDGQRLHFPLDVEVVDVLSDVIQGDQLSVLLLHLFECKLVEMVKEIILVDIQHSTLSLAPDLSCSSLVAIQNLFVAKIVAFS